MTLKEYRRKRKFNETPEPVGGDTPPKDPQSPLRFVVQLHRASRLHYDFRLEFGGSLKSWAVPKGPSLNPMDQRLAIYVEEHPLEYGSFEGIIPQGNYGAGTVMIWDEGTVQERSSSSRKESETKLLEGLKKGHLTFLLSGKKLSGEFALIKLKGRNGQDQAWLLVKKRDSSANSIDVTQNALSVLSGRSLEEIAKEAPFKNAIWISGSGLKNEKLKSSSISPRSSLPKTPRSEALPTDSKPTPERFPRKNRPMLATSYPSIFDQKGWLFEPLLKGTRAIAEVEDGQVHLYSKAGLPFEKKFPKIVEALQLLKGHFVLDGEISSPLDARYFIYDLLHLNGMNLRKLPLHRRKDYLKKLNIFGPTLLLVPFETQKGESAFQQASEKGWSGIVAKDESSPYHSGTSASWLKIEPKTQEKERGPILTHTNKILWPKSKITKGDLISYYHQIAPHLLPHLKDYPQSLHRHPNGIERKAFYQKNVIGYLPKWVKTHSIFSESNQKSVNYLLIQNEWTLTYVINLGCIELNSWISRVGTLDQPDFVVIDLDPDDNSFDEVIEVALAVHEILENLKVDHYCKTSGATGLHICVPCRNEHLSYETVREFAYGVCQLIHRQFPKNTSLERSPSKRRHKIYLDTLQNARGQTLTAPYSVRPTETATVSTPLQWKEVKQGLRPTDFTIHNILKRISKKGDLWKPFLERSVDLISAQKKLIHLLDASQAKRRS